MSEAVYKPYIVAFLGLVSLKKHNEVTQLTWVQLYVPGLREGKGKPVRAGDFAHALNKHSGEGSISESTLVLPWSTSVLWCLSVSEQLMGFSVILVFEDILLKIIWWLITSTWCTDFVALSLMEDANPHYIRIALCGWLWNCLLLSNALILTSLASFIFPNQQCPPDFKFQRAPRYS